MFYRGKPDISLFFWLWALYKILLRIICFAFLSHVSTQAQITLAQATSILTQACLVVETRDWTPICQYLVGRWKEVKAVLRIV